MKLEEAIPIFQRILKQRHELNIEFSETEVCGSIRCDSAAQARETQAIINLLEQVLEQVQP